MRGIRPIEEITKPEIESFKELCLLAEKEEWWYK